MVETPTVCTGQWQDIFFKLKDKKINVSKIVEKPDNWNPENNTKLWYIQRTANGGGGAIYADTTDTTYNYQLVLTIYGVPQYLNCCNTNPLIVCTCDHAPYRDFCIITFKYDKSWNVVDYTMPDSLVNDGINSLPIEGKGIPNYLIYVAGGIGLAVLLYLLTSRKTTTEKNKRK